VLCGSFTIHCMVASSIPCKLSLCADRAHARAGDSHISNGIDVACPTTQNVLAIASPHELHGESWPSSSTGTSSFCCNQQYSVTAVTTSEGAVAERYAYSAYGQPTILDASMDGKNGPPGFWGDNAIATGSRSAEFDWNCCGCKKEKDRSNTVK
jgi:hypothetical protein